MPSLAELSDLYPQQDNTLPVEQRYLGVPQDADGLRRVYINTGNVDQSLPIGSGAPAQIAPQTTDINGDMANTPNASSLTDSPIIKKLFGLDGEERYQTWPEKVVREALAAPHDTLNTSEPVTSDQLVAPAQAISALAGTGGLAGADASLGSTAFLRPALKYENKIYKAPIGGQHLDALPAHLADDFQAKAMNGEDINSYNFGFMNHKGQFLDREKALDYAIKEGLVDQSAGQYGALTSTLMADSSKPGTAIEAIKSAQPFYSALEHNVNAIQQGKMTGDQWLGTLSNKPGVKPEELDWTGTKDFLKERGNSPVTKSELQEHLQNNKVEIKDVDKGNEKRINELKNKDDFLTSSEVKELKALENNSTKHHSYQLAGGTNYREKLLTLPQKTGQKPTIEKGPFGQYQVQYPDGNFEGGYTLAEAQKAANEFDLKSNHATNAPSYKSSHWDEPNILAHVRMNDRMIDGKKSLHIEEIQSDWHQQGREKGYKSKEIENQKQELKNKINENQTAVKDAEKEVWLKETNGKHGSSNSFVNSIITDRSAKHIADVEEFNRIDNLATQAAKPFKEKMFDASRKYNQISAADNSVPDAPFKKSWHELALKRMIREAAEKGYDRLSWTPGEAQAARYDLSKQIDKLSYDPKSGHLQGFKGGGMALDNIVPKDKLPDFVGKEAADKILNKPTKILGNGYHTLENADLKIGGEGMKGFYDQIIPKALEKISGEKVKTAQTNTGKVIKNFDKTFEAFDVNGRTIGRFDTKPEAIKAQQHPVHYIDIPQQLKDKAMSKGFPLFSSTHMFTPIAGNPFESKDK